MISAISPRGAMRFMLVTGRITASVFVDFLKRLIHNWPRSIFLIIDGHPVRRSVAVSKFAASTEGRLQLFYLPSYSPELNPDEQVWNHLKSHGVGRQPVTGPEQLKRLIISHLRKVQNLPSLVRSFFNLPQTVYAAVP
jgi:transposase